jgi:hypothetical protein
MQLVIKVKKIKLTSILYYGFILSLFLILNCGAALGESNSGGIKYTCDDGYYRNRNVTLNMLGLIKGNFGALCMVISGLIAIISATFKHYKTALTFLITAIFWFTLREAVNFFFGSNYSNLSKP